MNIVIPEDLQKIIAEIVANKAKEEELELEEEVLDRLYIEILPEDYSYYPENKEEQKDKIIIEM